MSVSTATATTANAAVNMGALDHLPVAHVVRIEVAEAVRERRGLRYDAIIDALMRGGRVSLADLEAVEAALLAEVAAGNITPQRAKAAMQHLVGRLNERVNGGTARVTGDLEAMSAALGELKLSSAAFDRCVRQAHSAEEAREVRKMMGAALRDGVLTAAELAGVVQASAAPSTSGMSLHDVRAMYGAVAAQLRAGKIDRAKYDELVATLDRALGKKVASDPNIDPRVRELVIGLGATRAAGGVPTTAAEWMAAIDLMVFDSAVANGRRLTASDILALSDLLFAANREPTDAQVRALADGLTRAQSAGLITTADLAAATSALNDRVQRARFGIANVPVNLVATPESSDAAPTSSRTSLRGTSLRAMRGASSSGA